MVTISLCMIVKNEEKVLSRCLDSIAGLVDEIIIVDTGSDDKTQEIADRYTANLYKFEWIDDFAAARNFAFAKASMDYCMWMDADDVLEESEKEKFITLKDSLSTDIDFVMMKYNTSFDTAGKPDFTYYRERWIKNKKNYLWIGEVHEVIPPSGNTIYSDIAISHRKLQVSDPDRNLNIYKKLLKNQTILVPRQQYYYARELYYHRQYEEAIAMFLVFLDSPGGWIENKIEACGICADCYYKINKEDLALSALLKSFLYDPPRAELCCDIGKHFLERSNYKNAIFWYNLALKTERNDKTGGFVLPDCYDYIPCLQLCVCYDKLGSKKLAEEYNEKAGKSKPDSAAYLYNKQYFESIRTN